MTCKLSFENLVLYSTLHILSTSEHTALIPNSGFESSTSIANFISQGLLSAFSLLGEKSSTFKKLFKTEI